jgi:hypothetical protein
LLSFVDLLQEFVVIQTLKGFLPEVRGHLAVAKLCLEQILESTTLLEVVVESLDENLLVFFNTSLQVYNSPLGLAFIHH